MDLSSADHSANPPVVAIPREYNAAHDLIERNLRAGRGDKPAFIDDAGACSYDELARRVNRFASSLASLGLRAEDRVMICMLDTIDWPVAFLGAIKAGVVPVAANTLLKPQDYEYMLRDSRARVLFVSQALLPAFDALAGRVPTLERVIVSGAPSQAVVQVPSQAMSRAPAHQPSQPPSQPPVVGAATVATRSPACSHSGATTSNRRPPSPTNPASGSIRPDPPARPRARCTCTRASSRPRNSTRARCSASARTTSCSRRPSSSSPTAWATD